MTRILITSGPTRQFLDPVRYITNASSGRMGRSLAQAALDAGHDVVIVSGPVQVDYPAKAEVIPVVTTDDMLSACRRTFPNCDGLIGAAAPCDYQPRKVATQKIAKTGDPLLLHLVETADVVATMGASRLAHQWMVGFALETEDQRFRALAKLQRKSCDLMVLNGPEAMNAAENSVELIDPAGNVLDAFTGSKDEVARGILHRIGTNLIR